MTIQHTVSATETYDEKIKAAEEKIVEIRQRLNSLAAKNFGKSFKSNLYQLIRITIFFLLASSLYLLYYYFSNSEGECSRNEEHCQTTLILFFISSLILAAGFILISKTIRNNKDVKEYDHKAEIELNKLEQLCVRWREEKRAFLIAHNVNIVKTDHVLNDSIEGKLGGDEKECPKCAESVKSRAKVCRYCGYEFE